MSIEEVPANRSPLQIQEEGVRAAPLLGDGAIQTTNEQKTIFRKVSNT
jgi:hypothetical protein